MSVCYRTPPSPPNPISIPESNRRMSTITERLPSPSSSFSVSLPYPSEILRPSLAAISVVKPAWRRAAAAPAGLTAASPACRLKAPARDFPEQVASVGPRVPCRTHLAPTLRRGETPAIGMTIEAPVRRGVEEEEGGGEGETMAVTVTTTGAGTGAGVMAAGTRQDPQE